MDARNNQGRKEPLPLNLLTSLYGQRIAPFVPLRFFAFTDKEMDTLKDMLGRSLHESKETLEFVCCEFFNAAAFEAHRVSLHELASYTNAVAVACDQLIVLLERPGEVHSEYQMVHQILEQNWDLAQQGLNHKEMNTLKVQLKTLSADLVRLSAEHPATAHRGPPVDIALNYLMIYLRYLARAAGALDTLPGNEDDGYSSPMRNFAIGVLQLALRNGAEGLKKMDLPAEVYQATQLALNRYSEEKNVTRYLRFSENWYTKPVEKRQARRKK